MLPAVTPSIIGVSIFIRPAEQARGGIVGVFFLRCRRGQRRRQLLEERSIRLDRVMRPQRASHRERREGPSGRRGGEPGGLRDVQLGDADELFEVDARERIDVRLGLALGGHGNRELTCRLPAERSLVADHLGQIGQERDAPERVLWTLVAHGGMVGGWWPSPSRAPSPSQRGEGARWSSPARPAPSDGGCSPVSNRTRVSRASSPSTSPTSSPDNRRPSNDDSISRSPTRPRF